MKLNRYGTVLLIVAVPSVYARGLLHLGPSRVLKLDPSEVRAITTATDAIRPKTLDRDDYEVKIESYAREKVIQFLPTGERMAEAQSYAVVCARDGKKVIRVVRFQ